jgi:hypothetical protein
LAVVEVKNVLFKQELVGTGLALFVQKMILVRKKEKVYESGQSNACDK